MSQPSLTPTLLYEIKEGPQGRQGKQGTRGDPGPRGYPGIQGPTGCPGTWGPIGPTGCKGDQGDNVGFTGSTGSSGIMGPTGARGERGLDGLIQTFYQSSSNYCLKWLPSVDLLTSLPQRIPSIDQPNSLMMGSWLLLNSNGLDKMMLDLFVSRVQHRVEWVLQLSHPAKWVHVYSLGQAFSVPIHASNIIYESDIQIRVLFEFDSVDAYQEYMYSGAIYQINIQWY
jgi:hypothetical protein